MSQSIVGILNYGLGNLLSITRAFEQIGVQVKQITKASEMEQCTHLVLPGVGAFANGMAKLQAFGFIEPLKKWHKENKPLLGICLGMQMMLSTSEEFGEHEGLGLIPGTVKPLQSLYKSATFHKIPHIGWVDVFSTKTKENLGHFYLVHSFACFTDKIEDTAAIYKHNYQTISSIIRSNNTIGVQFHPEKSKNDGISFLKDFIAL